MGEIGFNIYRRKYIHTFLAHLDKNSFERSEAASMNSISQYIITTDTSLKIFD